MLGGMLSTTLKFMLSSWRSSGFLVAPWWRTKSAMPCIKTFCRRLLNMVSISLLQSRSLWAGTFSISKKLSTLTSRASLRRKWWSRYNCIILNSCTTPALTLHTVHTSINPVLVRAQMAGLYNALCQPQSKQRSFDSPSSLYRLCATLISLFRI